MNTEFLNQKFHSIQALRGIAALFVVVSHLSFIGIGAFGVDIFFCISGFIMMYVTSKNSEHFLTKRLIRIVPLYYMITIFTYVLLLVFPSMFMTTTAEFSYLIKSFFFIPYEIGDVIQPIVRVGWTINYEMFFYILFFISMKISKKYRGIICSCLLIVLSILGELFVLSTTFLTFYCSELLIEFVLGIFSFYLCEKIFVLLKDKEKKSFSIFLFLMCLVVIFAGFWLFISENNNIVVPHFSRVINWGIPAFMIFIAIFIIGCIFTVPKWLSLLGDISFSLYLLHYYPITFISRIAQKYDSILLKIVLSIVGIALVICISTISYYFIEKKLSSYLRKKFHI